jgi:predicted TIM-barrel fold metal-dependent hydrolase
MPTACHGHPRQAYRTSLALAEWLCRTADRIDMVGFKVFGTHRRDIARRINETLADIVSRYPNSFRALATIPGSDAEVALAEIEYALDTLKMDGVATSPSINDVYLGDRLSDPWFAELDRRGATLFAHPTFATVSKPLLNGLNPSVLEFVFDTTRMVTNLVVTGTKKRFANIKLIATHGGGTIPFLASRIQVLQHTFGVGPGLLELSPQEMRQGLASCPKWPYATRARLWPTFLLGLRRQPV